MPKGSIAKKPVPPPMPPLPETRTYPAPGTPHIVQHYDDVFPRLEGPPRVENYGGRSAMSQTDETVTLVIDVGAYRAVWELLEAEARRRWEVRNVLASAGAYVRGVAAFRAAWSRFKALESTAPPVS